MAQSVTLSIDDAIAVVTLNRPEKKNAVSLGMFDALAAIAGEVAADRSIRAVVLTGAGDSFCAGIDVSVFGGSGMAVDADGLAPLPGKIANRFQQAAYAWRNLEVPVLCAIRGVAYGAGLQIALGADIRYAAPDARLSIMEVKWGLIPDLAISVTARGLVAADRLKALAWSGRVVGAPEAQQLGLITETYDDPVAAAVESARAIRVKSPDAIRSMKRLVNESWQLSDSAALALEAELQLAVLGRKNQREAVMANLEKRVPDFED